MLYIPTLDSSNLFRLKVRPHHLLTVYVDLHEDDRSYYTIRCMLVMLLYAYMNGRVTYADSGPGMSTADQGGCLCFWRIRFVWNSLFYSQPIIGPQSAVRHLPSGVRGQDSAGPESAFVTRSIWTWIDALSFCHVPLAITFNIPGVPESLLGPIPQY
jgi:hypothetical protein